MTKILETPADLEWLREVHLQDCVVPVFALASIEGNEDWPTKITLYETDLNSRTVELQPDAEGGFYCIRPRY